LKHSWQPGPDGLSTYLIKSCINYIIFPIHYLIFRFLRFVSLNCNIYWAPRSSYIHLLYCLKLDFLELHQNKLELIFLYKVINNLIDSSELLSMINFKVTNFNLRNTDLFYSFSTFINLMSSSPINQILILANKYNIDQFVNSLYEFKRNVNLVVQWFIVYWYNNMFVIGPIRMKYINKYCLLAYHLL
jgi:hypothetical protein